MSGWGPTPGKGQKGVKGSFDREDRFHDQDRYRDQDRWGGGGGGGQANFGIILPGQRAQKGGGGGYNDWDNNGGGGGGGWDLTCFNCGGIGHKSSECPSAKGLGKGKRGDKGGGGDRWEDRGFGGGGKGGKRGGGDRKKGPSGPELPRNRITEAPVTGEVQEWKGKYGWINPTVPLDHPKAEKHKGWLYCSMSDLIGGLTSLTPGSLCQFHVFEDSSGLGAEEVIGS
eukprot:TRINITY_DN3938_c0_g1_i2.p1 TRINITY_DN3938_c0_g1~~TRINITY_DN3938_c0_g1_i2.p1  ORF type:complete len:227 (+),score=56.20 TRINITY_DN3938_c0_g1_i2:77-757(+)